MNNNIFRKYATTPTPSNFTGEDVIGDDLYGRSNHSNQVNQMPPQIQTRIASQQGYSEYQDPNLEEIEEININQNVSIPNIGSAQSTTITKNVVINLLVNLKINAI